MADMRGLEPRAARHKGSSPLLPTILCEVSSVGRAFGLQPKGRRFEPVTSHQQRTSYRAPLISQHTVMRGWNKKRQAFAVGINRFVHDWCNGNIPPFQGGVTSSSLASCSLWNSSWSTLLGFAVTAGLCRYSIVVVFLLAMQTARVRIPLLAPFAAVAQLVVAED